MTNSEFCGQYSCSCETAPCEEECSGCPWAYQSSSDFAKDLNHWERDIVPFPS